MRFIHTGDIHLGAHRTLRVPYEEKHQRCVGYLSEIFAVAEKEHAEAIVIAGDVFDYPSVPQRERDLLLRMILTNQHMPVMIIAGNHDIHDGGYTALRYLSLIQERLPNLHVAESEPKLVTVQGTNFGLIPCTEDQDKFDAAVKQMAEESNGPLVVVGHELVRGCSNDSGHTYERSGLMLRPNPAVIYWAMGHIHKTQQLPGLPNGWFSGSPAQHRIDEDRKRGVLLVDTECPEKPRFVRIQHESVKPLRVFNILEESDIPASLPKGSWNIVNCANSKLLSRLPRKGAVKTRIIPTTKSGDGASPVKREDPMDLLYTWLLTRRGYSRTNAAEAIKLVRSITTTSDEV